MNFFTRKNIDSFLLVFVIFLCLFGLWKFNIYQAWFYLTPMENFGSPPKQATKIVYINPIYDSAINSYRTYVFVQTENKDIYRCCSWPDAHDWVKLDDFQIEIKQDELECIEKIRKKWKIFNDTDKIINSLSRGWCDGDNTLDQYSSYQIEQNGTIRGKTVQENFIMVFFELFRFLCIAPILLMIAIWFVVKGSKPKR